MLGDKKYRNGEVLESTRTRTVRTFLFCTVGALIMGFNYSSLVDTAGLFPGGFAGCSFIITRVFSKFVGIHVPYSAIYIPLNLTTLYIGLKYLGKKFTFFSYYVIILCSLATDLFEKIPITYDVMLISIFGGIINGTAMSICLYVGASTGGTDFISIFFSQEKGKDVWNAILAGNVVVLIVAGILFGWDKALYSIVYQFCSTQVIHTLFKRYNRHTLFIISDKPEAISAKITFLTHHDATIFSGEGYYSHDQKPMIYSIVSSEEVDMVIHEIREIDPHAFINVVKTEQLTGNFHQMTM
ncbi:MAG: YitT family protein [Anaerovoracaceae bacterium]|jgi:uncharacterized membrane-anchored protein YitT (DUF2179 family)